jgi:WD40 repeat protein
MPTQLAIAGEPPVLAVGVAEQPEVVLLDARDLRLFARLLIDASPNTTPNSSQTSNESEGSIQSVSSIAWNAEGSQLAIGGDFGVAFARILANPDQAGSTVTISLPPCPMNRPRIQAAVPDSGQRISFVSFSPTSGLVTVVNHQGEIELWDSEAQERRTIIRAAEAPAIGAELVAEDRGVMSYHTDGRIRLWARPRN